MGLEQFLTAEDKVAALQTLQGRMFGELYTWCVRAGIDPESVDYATWVVNEPTTHPAYNTLMTISRLCDSLKIIDEKLGK